MRHRKRAFCLLVFILYWIRVNSQVIHDSPPVDVALTRPILPWLARYFVGAGKSTVFLDNPQSSSISTDPNNKNMYQLYNGTPIKSYAPKTTLRRAEAEDPPAEAPAEPKEEEKPAEEPPKEEAPAADPEPKPEEPKPEEEPAPPPPPDPPAEEAPPPDPPADPPAPEVTEAPKEVAVASPPALPFIIPTNGAQQFQPGYYYDGAFGPIASAARGIQGVPAAPAPSAPFYNMPYIYYPAPLPAYPAPYLPPIVSQPAFALPTTPLPPVPITFTFPPMPSPKPIVLDTPLPLPPNWPPMPEPIPITSITLPTVTIQPIISTIPAPQPILPPCLLPFPQVPLFSMPAHSILPFHSVVPPCSYMGQPLLSAPMASPAVVSPKYFYRNIGNAKPPESRRHQIYMHGPTNYKNI